MDLNETWVQFATVVGPATVVAIFALRLYHQLMVKWLEESTRQSDRYLDTLVDMYQVLGEVLEVLRGLNGKP